MTPDDLRAIMAYLGERVRLGPERTGSPISITFQGPTEEEMVSSGLPAEGVKQILQVPWWGEMVADIIETPEFCDPDDSPQQVLEYAKDVVSDYIRKRFPLDGK